MIGFYSYLSQSHDCVIIAIQKLLWNLAVKLSDDANLMDVAVPILKLCPLKKDSPFLGGHPVHERLCIQSERKYRMWCHVYSWGIRYTIKHISGKQILQFKNIDVPYRIRYLCRHTFCGGFNLTICKSLRYHRNWIPLEIKWFHSSVKCSRYINLSAFRFSRNIC